MLAAAARHRRLYAVGRLVRRARSWGVVAAAALTAACGSRSTLLDGEGSSGNGGNGGSAASGVGGSAATTGSGGVGGTGGGNGGTGASGGAGGVGGAAASGGTGASGGSGGVGGSGGSLNCSALLQVSPLLRTQGPYYDKLLPSLVASSDDGRQVTLAFLRRPIESPGPFAEVKHGAFRPWDNWPQNGVIHAPISSFAGPTVQQVLEVGRGYGGLFAAATSRQKQGWVRPRIHPLGGGPGAPLEAPLSGPIAEFVTRGPPGHHLVGAFLPSGHLFADVVKHSGPKISTTAQLLTCASQSIKADAVPYKDGWLVAASSGAKTPQVGCGQPGSFGPPTQIRIFFVDKNAQVSFVGGINAEERIASLSAAAHPDGMYVVWRGVTTAGLGPVRVMRRDVAKAGTVGPGVISGPTAVPFALDATAFGSGVAVVWANDSPGATSNLVLSLVNEAIGLETSYAFAPKFSGVPTIVASPESDSLVIGWPTVGLPREIELLRLDCVNPP